MRVNRQCPMPSFEAKRLDIGTERFGDPQSVEG
jgi:hypothetical protein